jgi:hypothetical protein
MTGLLSFLAIPYIFLGLAIYFVTFYPETSGWKSLAWLILVLLFYVPVLVILGILTILSYIYYGIKRNSW